MKKRPDRTQISGLTVLEVMVVLFTITVLAALLLPFLSHSLAPYPVYCINNQKQCALGFIMFANDNNNQYPWNLAATNSAYLPGCTQGDAAADFNDLQGTYIRAPFVFVCPTDPGRTIRTDLSPLKNLNLSYGAGYGSNVGANILTLDRHLVADGNPVSPGLFIYSTNQTMGWSSELHRPEVPRGVMSFYDGHAEIIPGTNINAAFQRSGLALARFAVP